MSLLNIYHFLKESSEDIFQTEYTMVQESKKLALDHSKITSTPNFNYGLRFVDEQLTVFGTMAARVPEITEYFSKVVLSKKFSQIQDMTIHVLPKDEIGTFKLDYLKEFVDKTFRVLEAALNGKRSFDDQIAIERLILLKKSLVVQKMPGYLKEKDFLRSDNTVAKRVNVSYLDRELLPYLRGFSHEYELILKTADEVRKTISECNEAFRTYDETITRLLNEPANEQNKPIVYKELTYAKYIYINASKYVIACLLRKLHTLMSNLTEYSKLKNTLQRILPEIDPFIESVETDEYDGNQLMGGSVPQILDTIDRVIIANGANADIEAIKEADFDYQPFYCMNQALKDFRRCFLVISEKASDPEIPFSEVIIGANFQNVGKKWEQTYRKVVNTSVYRDLSYPIRKASILKELSFAKKYWTDFTKKLHQFVITTEQLQNSLLDSTEGGLDTPRIRNTELADYLMQGMDIVERTFVGYKKAYCDRMNFLDSLMQTEMPEGPGILIESGSLMTDTLLGNLEVEKMTQDSMMDDLMLAIEQAIVNKKALSDPIELLLEADETPNNTNQTTNQNEKKEDQKPKVTDNSTENNENASNTQSTNDANKTDSSTDGKSDGDKKAAISERLKKIKEIILKFINNLRASIAKTAGNNLKFLKLTKDELLNRSYNNVSVEILDYDTNIQYVSLIRGIAEKIRDNDIQNRVMKGKLTSSDIQEELTKDLKLKGDRNQRLADRIGLTLKTSDSGAKEAVTKQFSNGELKAKMSGMIDYCEYYYGKLIDEFEPATKDCISAIDELDRRIRSNNEKLPDGLEATITAMTTAASTISSAVGDVARTRAQEYLEVCNSLRKKKSNKSEEKNTENSDQQNNADNTSSSQPTS